LLTLEKPRNYYELLEIPARGLTTSELKKAFRKASIKYHPDKNPTTDTTDLFLEVKMANDIINDEKMRFAYDVYA
jgi:DnaJ-class molecular chaperone